MANGPGVGGEAALSSGLGFNSRGRAAPELKWHSANATREKIPLRNPDMEGRATPFKDNPANAQLEEGLRKTISGDEAITEQILKAAGIKPRISQEIAKDLPKEAKKPQGFWAKIANWFRSFFN